MPNNRTVLTIDLKPTVGSRFQPTGFPDLGPAEFQRPDGAGGFTNALLVESAQSMANWAERSTWDEAGKTQVSELDGVPYLRVVDAQGDFLTSSRLEAHRLASAYVMDGRRDGVRGEDWLKEEFRLQPGMALDQRRLARAIVALDPLSLIHGVFFARKAWPWQPKVARAVTCFIEAYDVRPAVSGGVKKDSVNPTGGNTETGYGMVPHQRTEYTAGQLAAYVNVDHDQLRAYGLGEPGTELLESIIAFELASLFGGQLRLRTACDLEVVEVAGGELPTRDQAGARLSQAVAAAKDLLGPTLEVVWIERSSRKP